MIVHNGKPSGVATGCAWGILLLPVVFIGGGWALGKLVQLLTAVFG